MIDPILELLGWRETHIKREDFESERGKYLDYKLSTTQPIFILEAKKNFVRFDLPAGNARHFRVSGAISNDKHLNDAIIQVRNYAINKGVTYCCVTNGFQFVFFRPTNGLGVNWAQHITVVFRSHAEIARRFIEFYDILSYESVAGGRTAEVLPVHHLPSTDTSRFSKFCAELKVDFETRHRNALFPYTRELVKKVFQSLDNEDASPELLEYCYVESARDSSYERGIGELLKEHRTRIPEGAAKLQAGRKDAGTFQERFTKLSGRSIGSVTLILGTVGAGKTTFLNRFRKVFARDIIDDHYVWIQISFNSFVEGQDQLSDWINKQLHEALRQNYSDFNPFSWESLQKIYEQEISDLQAGLLNPYFKHDRKQYEIKLSEEIRKLANGTSSHLLRCLAYYGRRTGRGIILTFDNADQHSPELQNQVFLTAHKFSNVLRCMVFISLREESFWKNKSQGGLSAFHSTAFQISAPRIEQVLARRFKYAQLLIEGNVEINADGFILSDLDLTPERIGLIYRTLQNSILGEDRRFIRFLEYIAPGEVRQSLDLVARFLTSGHTNVNRIMDKTLTGSPRPVGFHEFLQAVMLGDRVHFREDLSDIINLFAVDGRGDRSHFNRLAVLSRVLAATGENSNHGKGFIPFADVVRDCETLGITAETCSAVVGFLLKRRLLATETFIKDISDSSSYIRATASAYYYVTELGLDFTYIDLLIIDTEIGRNDVRQTLSDLSRQIYAEQDRFNKLLLRVDRARHFVTYLKHEYAESALAKSSDKFDLTARSLAERLYSNFQSQTQQIIENAKVAFGRT